MRFRSRRVWAQVRMAMAVGLASAGGQAVQTANEGFDIASIKPSKPDARGYSIRPFPGRLSAENVTLKLLISEAYHVFDFQVSGGPKWIDSDRYDVEAKTGGDVIPSGQQLRGMLRKLLEDRFALKVRQETKEMAVFAMVTVKGGSKLQPSKDPQAQVMFRVFQRRQITAANAPLEHLTETLTWLLGRPVVDRTGLQGSFDYKLEWSPDEVQIRSTEAPVEIAGNALPLDGALQQQLGLKLVSQKDQVGLIVVESAERPIVN